MRRRNMAPSACREVKWPVQASRCGQRRLQMAVVFAPRRGTTHMGAMIDPDTERPAGALVLFSGGQDSTVCLAWALDRHERVETVGFDYGQRHAVELQARAAVRARIAERFPEWAPRL